MLGYIVRGGQYSLGYIVRGTLYPRLYCPGGQYKGGQYILRHQYCKVRYSTGFKPAITFGIGIIKSLLIR